MAITRIQLLSVPVSSPDRALEFYVELLGFELLRNDPMGPDMRWVQIAPKGSPTSVSLVTWFDSMAPGSMKGLMFETDTFEGDIERLKGASVTVSDVQQEPWGRYVMFDDPDGNGIILRALGSEAWAEH
jgi:catechol 2,3-dioxygenase-like lactoylglutathione lyase family enzyme